MPDTTIATNNIVVPVSDAVSLSGILSVPERAVGVVLFAHGSGSSRLSPRNTFVADMLNENHIATILIDLLTETEDAIYETRFDIDLLTERLDAISQWITSYETIRQLPLGLFGASTGAASALNLAAISPDRINSIVSRGGRPDMSTARLPFVQAPTLLIVGGNDDVVIDLNRSAYAQLHCTKKLLIIPGATHLFEEPGALEQVAHEATRWFLASFPHAKKRP